jgi:isopentenyl diphosphate isomerase/L-lactate dehydrogenase-like FMN-dependent dehydrogenase
VLRDGFKIDLKTTLFGKTCEMPLGFAPWAMNKIVN